MGAVVSILASLASWMLRTFGLAGCALVIVLVYYDGLPLLNRYPWLADLPIIGQFAVGHVETYAADQVKLATATQVAKCTADKRDLVSSAEVIALRAQIDREQQLRQAAEEANTEAQKRADVTRRAKEDAEAQLAKLRQATEIQGFSKPTDGEMKWLDEN